MLPSEMALRPGEPPWLPKADPAAPAARPREVITLADGDTLDLVAGIVRRSIAGRDYTMFGFNGQYPGPLLSVARGSAVTVRLKNELPAPTTVHWHGVRLDNQFDGVPDAAHPAVEPGQSFTYQLKFPDEGLFWYHPHVREDIQQDLGLYGNIFVSPAGAPALPGPRDEFLILDDLLIGDAGLVPYGAETPTHAAMGRFGNVMLVNGETTWSATTRTGEVTRLHLTNVSNTRTFNLSFGADATMRVVSSDLGDFASAQLVESVVIAPAERYAIDVSFPKPGRYPLVNRVRAIDHLYGRFFDSVDTLGIVSVSPGDPGAEPIRDAAAGRDAAGIRAMVQANLGKPPQHTLELSARFTGLPFVSEQLMRLDSIYFNPVEWEGTMPGMNQATTGAQAHWVLRDPATGAENMDIRWSFRQGDLVRLQAGGGAKYSPRHAPSHPHPWPAIPGAGGERYAERESGVEGYGAPAGGRGAGPAGGYVQPRELDAALSHCGAPAGGDDDALRRGDTMNRPIVLAALATLLVSNAGQAQRPTLDQDVRQIVSSDSALIAITGVTVIDGKGTPAVPGQTVVIRDGRVAEVGAAAKVKVPAGAQAGGWRRDDTDPRHRRPA